MTPDERALLEYLEDGPADLSPELCGLNRQELIDARDGLLAKGYINNLPGFPLSYPSAKFEITNAGRSALKT